MKKLIFVDLDGTTTPTQTWLDINTKFLGLSFEEDQQFFDEWRKGYISYGMWIEKIVAVYKNRGTQVTHADIEAYAQGIPLENNVVETIQRLKDAGFLVVLLSGSLSTVVSVMAARMGIETWKALSSVVYNDEGILVDIEHSGDEAAAKLAFAQQFAKEQGFVLEDAYAIGDGGNEIELFKHVKGVALGGSAILAPVAWRKVDSFKEIANFLP